MNSPATRIGLFSKYFHTPGRRGIAVYTKQLTIHIAELILETPVTIIDYFLPESNFRHMPVIENMNFDRTVLRIPGRLFDWLTGRLNWDLITRAAGRLDILHALHEQVPVCRTGSIIMTVHGPGPLQFPDMFTDAYRSRWMSDFKRGLERADRVICVSETLADELRLFRPDLSDRFIGIPSGVSEIFLDEAPSMPQSNEASTSGMDFPYILIVGAADPGKNLLGFLESFRILHDRCGPDAPHLVLAGERRWGGYEQVDELKSTFNLDDVVHFTGYVDQAELPALYRGSELFVFPSLFEGFGLPLVEAMASGAPCLVSDIPVFHEIGGEFAEYFDPSSVEGMADKMEGLLRDSDRLLEMGRRGKERARTFTWSQTARKTVRVYEEVTGEKLV